MRPLCVIGLKDNEVRRFAFAVHVRPRLKGFLVVGSSNNYSMYYSLYSGL